MSKRSIKALTLSLFLITTSMGIANPIVPLYAKDLGATYTDLGLIGVAWSAPYCFFPALAGLWSDRIGRLKVFLVGVLTSIVVPLLLLASRSPLDIALVRLFHGVGLSFLWVAGEALISDVTKEEERARHLGLFNASWAMGYFIGPMISASTIERAGYAGIFWISFYVGLTSPLA
jgi:MFS family permease